jgi:hypothetical protein
MTAAVARRFTSRRPTDRRDFTALAGVSPAVYARETGAA